MKKLFSSRLFNRLGIWSLPFACVATLPFLLASWQSSNSLAEVQQKAPPSLSQLQESTVPESSPISTESPLQKPQPKVLKEGLTKTSKSSPSSPEAPKTSPQPKPSPIAPKTSSPPFKDPASPLGKQPEPLKPAPANYQPPPVEIRVAILRDEPGTTIGTSNRAILSDRNGKQLKILSGSQGWWIQPDGASLSLGNSSLPGVVWIQPTQGSLVYVGDRWFRGKILVISQGSSLLVVNYVDLEHYLYSVVGSEMHANAPTEALKAQAIAARSYALVHIIRPASSWYDLGNTQRWQVYKGLTSEYNTTHQAVGDTIGQILSHQGGVVESLYAATDDIVLQAHGGRGMSQTGAYELAKQGYDYQQILNHYYPGVGLARLILQR